MIKDEIKSKQESAKKVSDEEALKLKLILGLFFVFLIIIVVVVSAWLITLESPKSTTFEQYEEGLIVDVQIMDDLTLVVFDNANYLILETSRRHSSTQTHVTAYAELFNLKGERVKIFYLNTEYGNYYQDVMLWQ